MPNKVLFYCTICFLVLKILFVGLSANFSENFFIAGIKQSSLTQMVNRQRSAEGLNLLRENSTLSKAAMLKARDMVEKEYFAHQSPDGNTPWHWFKEAGYNYKYAGENLAIGYVDSDEVYNAWYNSETHRANILNPNYTEIGTAILSGFGKNNATIVVQLFGSPQSETASVVAAQIEPLQMQESDRYNYLIKNLSLLSYKYEVYLQYAIYLFITVLGSITIFGIFADFKASKKNLIFNSAFMLATLLSASLI